MKNIIQLTLIVMTALFFACEDKANAPQVIFDGDVNQIDGVLAGDIFTVKGTITSEASIENAFYFHQRTGDNGLIEEEGDYLTLESDGTFSLGFVAEASTVGVKIIVTDSDGNRTVKVYKVNLVTDEIEIVLNDPQSIESINDGDSFNIKGLVTSKSKLTELTYTICRGEFKDEPISMTISGATEATIDLELKARAGMTGVIITAKNKGQISLDKMFEIKKVVTTGPVIILEKTAFNVFPYADITIKGNISSEIGLTESSYIIVRTTGQDAEVTLIPNEDGSFTLPLKAEKDIQEVIIKSFDTSGMSNEESVSLELILPEMIVGEKMVTYKNIVLRADKFPMAYFSFSKAPYVLSKEEADLAQSDVHIIFLNCFISATSGSNGLAFIAPSGNSAGSVKGQDYVQGWSVINEGRLFPTNDITTAYFDALNDNSDWDEVDSYLKEKAGNSKVLRINTQGGALLKNGTVFGVSYILPGTTYQDNSAFVKIVQYEGDISTSATDTGNAWIELEIKRKK